MRKYYQNNLVYAYEIYLMGCTVIVALAGALTFYLLMNNYKKYQQNMAETYVYSTNGASIQVNVKQNK